MTNTKAVQLTVDEVQVLIQYHGRQIAQSVSDWDDYIERMRYLNKRLQDFNTQGNEPKQAHPEQSNWGNNNG